MAHKPINIPVVTAEPVDTDVFIKGLWRQNPIFVQVLGMCPTLAVTNSAINALTMGLATLFVLVMSCGLVSLLRRVIPHHGRIAGFVLIVATFVTIADYAIQAVSLEVHKALGAFVSLIVVNCIILGRIEAFAAKNDLKPAVLDALGMGLGFAAALLVLGGVRELLGSGSIFGARLFGESFAPWVVMLLPSGGFLVLGVLVLGVAWLKTGQAEESK